MDYILDHEGKMYRKFFEDIAAIPHESFKEKALSDYIVNFAQERGLWHHQDEVWNVIVKKPASPGYEAHDPVMIQGHIDMVCVKTPESNHNFDTDPLQLYVKDGFLRARDTTLGADCGHGISYMLSILDDKELRHPPLECLFTVQEEVGVGGPKHLNYSLLSAKRLIFTDSMGEGSPELSTTSVLGGNFVRPITKGTISPSEEGHCYRLTIDNLAGGHAAVDINKGRANAIKLLARFAYHFSKSSDIRICRFCGGSLKNNIPAKGELIFHSRNSIDVEKETKAINETVHSEHGKTDPKATALLCETQREHKALSPEESKNILQWIMEIPTGTYMASPEDPAFPLTSRNLGTVDLTEDKLILGYMYRTSISSHMEMLFDEQEILLSIFQGKWEKEYDYPGYRKEAGTPMYQVYESVYEEMTGKKLTPIHIHAGTDVGTILQGMGGMDVIGIGPNTYKFHTPDEALDLASYDRVYQYMINLLERL